jgi:hypothetical protein
MTSRRFPPPWTIKELAECFIVRDANGQALAYVYFEEEPGRRSAAPVAHARAAESGRNDDHQSIVFSIRACLS